MCHAFQPCVLWMLLGLYSKTEMPAERSLTQPQDRSFLPIRKTDSMDHKNASFSHNWWHHGTHRVNWSRCWEIPTASILFHFWYHGLQWTTAKYYCTSAVPKPDSSCPSMSRHSGHGKEGDLLWHPGITASPWETAFQVLLPIIIIITWWWSPPPLA